VPWAILMGQDGLERSSVAARSQAEGWRGRAGFSKNTHVYGVDWMKLTWATGGMANLRDKLGVISRRSCCSSSEKASFSWYAGRLYRATRASMSEGWESAVEGCGV
jgi:hypothetical protein